MPGQEGAPVEILATMTGAAVANTAYEQFPPEAKNTTYGYRSGIAGAALVALSQEVRKWPEGDARLIVARQYAEALLALIDAPRQGEQPHG